jgi:uncharacterized membrane protein YjgN (DUF898 family)
VTTPTLPEPNAAQADLGVTSEPQQIAHEASVTGAAEASVTAGGEPDTPASAPFASQPQYHPFRFTGDAREYFRIWIVNMFLTLVTLGIYSAWAKVRKMRYFYGHTWLVDSNFEYHGKPIAILKGRLIAAALFSVYWAASHLIPRLGTAILLVLMLLAPWFIARSLMFNARNSSYRNIRFGFHAEYLDVLKAIWPVLLVPISILLLPEIDYEQPKLEMSDLWIAFIPSIVLAAVYPYIVGSLKRLHIGRSRFGNTPFKIDVEIARFYLIWLQALGIVLVAVIAIPALMIPALFIPVLGIVALGVLYVFVTSAIVAYTKAHTANLVFNASKLGERITFASTLGAWKLAGIYFVNTIAILFSLGLLIPWATIRLARYRAERLRLVTVGSLEGHFAEMTRDVAATGEELGEMFDVDLSL